MNTVEECCCRSEQVQSATEKAGSSATRSSRYHQYSRAAGLQCRSSCEHVHSAAAGHIGKHPGRGNEKIAIGG